MEGKVVVFIRTSSAARAPVYAHLRSLGAILVIVHPVPPPPVFDNCFHFEVKCETCDVEVLQVTLNSFLTQHQLEPDAIISFDEYGVYPAALLAERAHLRSIPFHSSIVQITNIKSLFRTFCKNHHITSPSMQILQRPPFLHELINEISNKKLENIEMHKEERENRKQHHVQQQQEHEEQEEQEYEIQKHSEYLSLKQKTNGIRESWYEHFRRHVVDSMKNELQFPIVLKPSPGAGSLLAKRCDTIDEVCAHALKAWQVLDQHPDVKHFATLHNKWRRECTETNGQKNSVENILECVKVNGDKDSSDGHEFCCKYTNDLNKLQPVELLMEEYIDGQEIDMDCAIEHGKIMFCAISDNFETKPPHFVEEGGLCPSSLPAHAQEALYKLLESYVRVFKTEINGLLHFEAKYSFHRKAAYVIEVNCRMGSAETNMMVQTAFRKIQLGESLVRCALNLPLISQLEHHYPEYIHIRESTQSMEQKTIISNSNGSNYSNNDDCPKTTLDGVIDYNAMGGVKRGLYPPTAVAASVNLYPQARGKLKRVQVPEGDPDLVAFSVSAQPGQCVAPPPSYDSLLLCWMVARGTGVRNAMYNIHRLTSAFVQEIDEEQEHKLEESHAEANTQQQVQQIK